MCCDRLKRRLLKRLSDHTTNLFLQKKRAEAGLVRLRCRRGRHDLRLAEAPSPDLRAPDRRSTLLTSSCFPQHSINYVDNSYGMIHYVIRQSRVDKCLKVGMGDVLRGSYGELPRLLFGPNFNMDP